MHPVLPLALLRQAPTGPAPWATGWSVTLPNAPVAPTVRYGGGGDDPGVGGGGRGRRTRCLVLASTRMSHGIVRRAVLGRAAQRPTEFHVVVTRHRDLAHTAIVALAVGGGMVVDPFPSVATDREAEAAAHAYLTSVLGPLVGEVGAISGSVGEANPIAALTHALQGAGYDDIVVVAPSSRLARLLRLDLRSRAARRFRLPVTEAPAS